MKIKKLNKLSILVFIFAFTSAIPGYSTGDVTLYTSSGDGVGQNLNVEIAPSFSIEKASGANMNGVTSIESSTSLAITTPISFSYNISTNEPSTISISATAPTTTGAINALFGTAANAMKIVFTKSNSTATADAVTNASSNNPIASSNAKAVAFTFTPQSTTATFGTAPTPTVENNALLYNCGAGSFNLPFIIQGSSLSGTFSKNDDVSGDYKATLIVSKVNLD